MRTKKLFIALFVLSALLISSLPLSVAAAEYDGTSDKTWFKMAENEFTLTTAAQLAGLAELAAATDFEGKTIKLGADIVFNTGNAADWETTAPTHTWTPIANFAGTLDGQGHSISGLYMQTTSQRQGFINYLKNDGVVKNLSIVNTYFSVGTNAGIVVATVDSGAGRGAQVLDVYSDGIIAGNAAGVGGIVGTLQAVDAEKPFLMERCVFAGEVNTNRTSGVEGSYVAGILGNGNNKDAVINDCINLGKITGASEVAGILGRNGADTKINRCINVGEIKSHLTPEEGKEYYIASILGCFKKTSANAPDITATITNCYHLNDSAPDTALADKSERAGTVTGTVVKVAKADILGNAAKTKLSGFDFADVWTTVSGDYPLPKSVAAMLSTTTPTPGGTDTDETDAPGETTTKAPDTSPTTSDMQIVVITLSVMIAAAFVFTLRTKKQTSHR